MKELLFGFGSIDVNARFQTNDDCNKYLYDIKWRDGYRCRVCGCDQDIKGRTRFHRRCQHCKYDESVICHTMLQDLRMPVLKAFRLLFLIIHSSEPLSSVSLSEKVGVQQKTAWRFQQKVDLVLNELSIGTTQL